MNLDGLGDVAEAVVRLAHDAQRASCAASIARCLAQRERCGRVVKGTLCIAHKELKVCEGGKRLALAASILRPPAERQRLIVIGHGFLRFTETLIHLGNGSERDDLSALIAGGLPGVARRLELADSASARRFSLHRAKTGALQERFLCDQPTRVAAGRRSKLLELHAVARWTWRWVLGMKLEQEDAGFLGNERNRHGAVASAREVNTDQPSWISEHEPQFSTPTLHRDAHVLTGTDSDVIQVRFPLKQLSLQGIVQLEKADSARRLRNWE